MFLFGTALFVFLTTIYPYLKKKYMEKLKATWDEKDRISYFKFVILSDWAVALFIGLVVYFSPAAWTDMGIAMPDMDFGIFMAFLIGSLIGILLVYSFSKNVPSYQKRMKKQYESVPYLLPAGTIDKRYAVLYVLTTGLCDEWIYRGFLIHVLSSAPFQLNTISLVVIGAIVFGISQYHQGWKGVIENSLVGLCFCYIFISTQSLFLPVIFNIMFGLKLVFVENEDANIRHHPSDCSKKI